MHTKVLSENLKGGGYLRDQGARNTTHVTEDGVELEPYILGAINIRMFVNLHCVLCQTEA